VFSPWLEPWPGYRLLLHTVNMAPQGYVPIHMFDDYLLILRKHITDIHLPTGRYVT